MAMTFDDFCDKLMSDDHPMERLEPEGLAAEFATYFHLPACRGLNRLAELFERTGIGKVSPAKLPRTLRGIHYTLPDGSYAIHYQEGQWAGTSEYTLLHEGYEIVYETLWDRCHNEAPEQKVCSEADRFAAAALMPPETFSAYAQASGLDVVELHRVFRCSYSAAALRLGEVLCAQPLAVVLYEREEDSDPATWERPTKLGDLRATVVRRTAGFPPLRSRLLTGWRNGSPRSGKPLSSGSLAERAARSGGTEYAEGDGIAVVAAPVLWKGRLAKIIVVAVPWEQRRVLEPQLDRRHCHHPQNNPGAVPRFAAGIAAVAVIDQ